MRALSIRQPYVELILRGIKTVEYRTKPTRIIGERFYLYASKGRAKINDIVAAGSSQVARSLIGAADASKRAPAWSIDLAMPREAAAPPRWLLELAEQVRLVEPGTLLPTGVIVGSAMIDRVSIVAGDATGDPSGVTYAWHLHNVERMNEFRAPTGHPQPVWFNPF